MKNNNTIWIILGIIFLLFLFFFGLGSMGYGGFGMMGGYYGSGMMVFGWLYGILVLVALILLIIWLAKQIRK